MWKLIVAHKLLALAIVSTPVAIAVARRRRAVAPAGLEPLPTGHAFNYTGDNARTGINDQLPTFTSLVDNPDQTQLRIRSIEVSDAGVNKGTAQGGGPTLKPGTKYGAGAMRDDAGFPVRPPTMPSSPTLTTRQVDLRPAPVGTVITRSAPTPLVPPAASSPTRVGMPQPRPQLPNRPPLHIPAPITNRGSFK